MTKKVLIASSKDWISEEDFQSFKNDLEVIFIKNRDDFSIENVSRINPEYIFVVHWSWIVRKDFIDRFKPIMFHTAPLPMGRGGSPIQNLILAGYKESPVWALLMSEELDAGDLIISRQISLDGKLSEIFLRIKKVVLEMIMEISQGGWQAFPQKGETTVFSRLSTSDNQIRPGQSLEKVYDQIRMVDDRNYQKTYLYVDGYKLEFSDAELGSEELLARVRITVDTNNV